MCCLLHKGVDAILIIQTQVIFREEKQYHTQLFLKMYPVDI